MSASRIAADLRARLQQGQAEQPMATFDLFEHRPTTKREFQRWLEEGLGSLGGDQIIVAADVVLTEGHTSPLELAWSAFCLAQGRRDDGSDLFLTEEELAAKVDVHETQQLLHGPRGGGKTLMVAAILMSLLIFVPGYGAVHTASEIQQSETMIGYLKEWIEAPGSPIGAKVKPRRNLKDSIEFVNGSILILITGSTRKGVNSKHYPWLSYDEIELADPDMIKEAMGIPQEQPGRNLPAIVMLLSTQKEAGLTMTLLIKQAKQGLLFYRKWNWLEVVEKCPPFRTRSIEAVGLNCSDYPKLVERKAFLESRVALSQRQEHDLFKTALAIERLQQNCSLVEFCEGKAKHGAGYMKINTVKQRLSESGMGREMFLAQMQCSRPSPAGLVYSQFSDQNVDYTGMIVAPKVGTAKLGIIDPGYAADAMAFNLMQINLPHYDFFFEETIPPESRMSDERVVEKAWEYTERFDIDMWIIDNNAIQLCDKMMESGLLCERAPKRPVEEGVVYVTVAVKDDNGFRAVRVNGLACPNTVECFYNYKRVKGRIPRQKVDHHMDCVRYGIQHVVLFGLDGGDKIRAGSRIHHS